VKTFIQGVLVIGMIFVFVSCASTGYNSQKGAAIGAGIGAIAGQAIGQNTAGTLIGTAAGALAGLIAGNAIDQDVMNQRIDMAMRRPQVAYASPEASEDPPGEWVEVPGQWMGGKWIPSHRAWVPVNPDNTKRYY